MHELWLCKSILEIINQSIVGKPYKRIKKIYLEIGELVALEKDSLLFNFAVIAKETLAKEAILEIIDIPALAKCEACQKTVSIKQYAEPCQYCKSYTLIIMQGEELRVKSMEVE